MYGYMGTILRVDLTSGKTEKQSLSEELIDNYIGGRGINAKILYDEVKVGLDSFDPESRLIFGTGPLSGTPLASGRINITAKSPITNILGDSNAGSHFGPEMKYTGYDHIVFTGKADKPVYLWIENDDVQIRDGHHLWGKMTQETQRLIKEELRDPYIQVACIGPAGENLVRPSSILVGSYGACGRTGMGAVMGSKNLKAVAVRGTKGVKIAEPDTFRRLALDLKRRMMENPLYPAFSTYGTCMLLDGTYARGTIAFRNAQQTGAWAGYDGINAETLHQKYVTKKIGCFGCVNHCRSWFEIKEGPYTGLSGVLFEYATQSGFGALCDISYAPALCKAYCLCNEYGLDQSEVGQMIAAAMEWYERGWVSREDTDGIELTWGNYEAAIEIIHKIANREGIGDLLAEGGLRAAKKVGKGAEDTITHSKGQVRTTGDLRGSNAYLLGLATATRGADHLRGSKPTKALGSYENQAKVVYETQTVDTLADALEVCKFTTPMLEMELSIERMAGLFGAATGIKKDEDEMREIADRIWTVERAFIVREGITRKDDILVGRFANEPVHGGPLNGLVLDQTKWNEMLDEYYDLVGWDKNTGIPSRAKLEALGLYKIADELWKTGG
ncbi:MAG: aldehyde ferredoxin oxidoreductase family protein [Dehalococcoidia bacterium]|jgi:aldehyde:ferredoxin oxidoreductase